MLAYINLRLIDKLVLDYIYYSITVILIAGYLISIYYRYTATCLKII